MRADVIPCQRQSTFANKSLSRDKDGKSALGNGGMLKVAPLFYLRYFQLY